MLNVRVFGSGFPIFDRLIFAFSRSLNQKEVLYKFKFIVQMKIYATFNVSKFIIVKSVKKIQYRSHDTHNISIWKKEKNERLKFSRRLPEISESFFSMHFRRWPMCPNACLCSLFPAPNIHTTTRPDRWDIGIHRDIRRRLKYRGSSSLTCKASLTDSTDINRGMNIVVYRC